MIWKKIKRNSFQLTIPITLLMLLGGCLGTNGGINEGDSGKIRPLSEVTINVPEFTDLRPRSLTVLLDTTVPMVCAAAYGITTEYGQLATDTDMSISGHQNHHPRLSGLRPNTTYHIRLQGIAPDGKLYQSEDFTIKTPPDTKPKPSFGVNLAKQASVASVSSNFGGGDLDSAFGGNKAIDGKIETEWSSNGDGDNAYITIELHETSQLKTIGFLTRTMGSTAEIKSITIKTDSDEIIGPLQLSGPNDIEYIEVDITTKSLRFDVHESTGGNTGAVEIEIYG